MADTLTTRLQREGHIELVGDRNHLLASLEQAISEELSVEDRLNAEVRQLLKAYAKEVEQGKVDYQKMFTMIKQKLVRERGLIL